MAESGIDLQILASGVARAKLYVTTVVTEFCADFATATRSAIALRTPVKTGRAASGWNLSVDEPNSHENGPLYNNPGGCVSDGQVSLQGHDIGDELHIANAVYYIDKLNAGSSRQAPAQFVEITVGEMLLSAPTVFLRSKAKVKL